MRVTFVLPDVVTVPVGGIKMAYEYANRLSRRGHQIGVVHLDLLAGSDASRRLRRNLRFALWQRGVGGWFRLHPGVKTSLIDPDRPDLLTPADAVVAIGWRTVPFVHRAPTIAGRPHYLAMDYMGVLEGDPGEVDSAWRLPVRKIVTSRWLLTKVAEICGPDEEVAYVPIAVGEEFRVIRDPTERDPATILMLYHPAPHKGSDDGMAALELAHRSRPLKVVMFGGVRPTRRLPDWIRFVLRPRDLLPHYNSASIFLHPSRHEGWGLPPAEAMACGCAVVAAANIGVREYAVHERNALLAPVGEPEALAAAIVRLIDDGALRLRLARQGQGDIAGYSWDRAVGALESVLAGP